MVRSTLLAATKVLAMAVVLVAAVACSDDSCSIDTYTRDLAGIGAIGCNASPDPELIGDCISEQQAARKPFRAIFLHDDGGYHAIVGTGDELFTQRPKGEGIEEASCTQLETVTIDDELHTRCADPGAYSVVCE